MHKFVFNSFLVVACAAGFSASATHAFAQDNQTAQQDSRPDQQRSLEALTQKLSLTDDQKARLQPIFDERRQKIQDLRASGARPMQKRRQIKKIIDDGDAKIKPILTAEQWQQYKQIEEQVREQKKEQMQQRRQQQ